MDVAKQLLGSEPRIAARAIDHCFCEALSKTANNGFRYPTDFICMARFAYPDDQTADVVVARESLVKLSTAWDCHTTLRSANLACSLLE